MPAGAVMFPCAFHLSCTVTPPPVLFHVLGFIAWLELLYGEILFQCASLTTLLIYLMYLKHLCPILPEKTIREVNTLKLKSNPSKTVNSNFKFIYTVTTDILRIIQT